MKINQKGYWENNTDEGHGVDRYLAIGLKDFFETEHSKSKYHQTESKHIHKLTIADIGCGTGFYTKFLNTSDLLECIGIDGNPYTKEIAGPDFIIADLSKRINWSYEYEIGLYSWALCLEVGEHIPAEFERNFIRNVCDIAEFGIVISWAVEGQGGDGHVNCRNNDYIISRFNRYGFNYDSDSTVLLRLSASEYPNSGWWFKNTLMVFRRR